MSDSQKIREAELELELAEIKLRRAREGTAGKIAETDTDQPRKREPFDLKKELEGVKQRTGLN